MFGKSIFKSYSGFINAFSRISDPLIIVIAAIVAFGLRFSFADPHIPKDYRTLIVFAFFCVILVFPLFDLYSSWRGKGLFKQGKVIFLAWFSVVLLMIFILFGLKISADYSRIWLAWWSILGLAFLLLTRMMVYAFLQYQRKRGRNIRYVVIVGAGDLGKQVLSQIKNSPWTGYKINALFDDGIVKGSNVESYKVLGSVSDVEQYVASNQVDEIWIALPLRAEVKVKELLYDLRHYTINIKLIPDIFGFSLLNQSMTEIAGLPAVNLSDSPMGGSNRIIKAIEDRVLGLVFIVLIFPLAILIALAIKLTSPGPVLFKQRRHGWDRKIINVYKFRTMDVHVEKIDDVVTQTVKNDARVTKLGAFLRRTSLDELPQLYNVLQGRMSLVGPRPHAIQHNELFKEKVDRYMLRHMVKPGITGWAQVNGYRGETDTLDKMKKRIEYDLYYIENWSLWFDLKIILLTIFKGFINKNAY